MMNKLMIDIQEDIEFGILSFSGIARKHDVPVSWVHEAWNLLCEQEAQSTYTQSMDYTEAMYEERYELDY